MAVDLLICVATDLEGAILRERLKDAGDTIRILRTGVGAVNAAHAVTLALTQSSPATIVVCGIGGAYPGSGLGIVRQGGVTSEKGRLCRLMWTIGDGRLLQVVGESLERHIERLWLTRSHFLERMTGITVADWDTVREPPGVTYTCSPAWVVFHLVEHEAGHLFQIREIARRWRDSTGVRPAEA